MEEAVLADAYRQFLDARQALPWPAGYPIGYALAKKVEEQDWGPFLSFHVEGDLRETINLLNTWRRHLHDWEIWMGVVDAFADNDAWTIRDHFIEPLVFYCMMLPSSTRDLLAGVATHAIHYANRQTSCSYPDKLAQDDSPRPLNRRKKESQVSKIGTNWRGTRQFMCDLAALDSKAYRTFTRNFRNLASHAIAPKFEFGYTNMVTRSIVSATNLVRQGDGTYSAVDDPTKKCVAYGFGGTPPLDLREVLNANTGEYRLAAQAFNSYQTLLIELMEKLRASPPPPNS
ncbi:MAG: hypothetical protein JWP34_3757 [Massilia sp.]|nr:hypothetical protein [Massilia sp.]